MTESTPGDPFATPPGAPNQPAPGQPAQFPPHQPYPPQQAYPPQPGYSPYGYPPQRKPKTWMNILSLCLVAGVFILPGITQVAGIVFGHLGVRAAARGEADQRGVGLAGLIINYVFLALSIIAVVAYIAFIVYIINSCGDDPNSYWCGTD